MGIYLNLTSVKRALKQAEMKSDNLGVAEHKNDMLAVFNRELLSRSAYAYKTCVRDHNTRWVYREGDSFCLGYIGYGDFMDGGDGVDRFAVFSPNIENNKYKRGHRQNMSLADSLARALKNTSAIRPLSMKQVMALTGSDCASARLNWVDRVQDEVRSDRNSLVDNFFDYAVNGVPKTCELQEEIRHLVDTGHEFLNPKLGEKLKKMFESIKELAEVTTAEAKPMTFVEVVTTFDKPKFRVAKNVDTGMITRNSVFAYEYVDVYTQEEVPQDIMGKLANLSMVPDNHYVAGVGYRHSENIFYLRND
jgi:hypothetical protein